MNFLKALCIKQEIDIVNKQEINFTNNAIELSWYTPYTAPLTASYTVRTVDK